MTCFEAQQTEELFQFLEIYDGYEELLEVMEVLGGFIYKAGYGEGILGRLVHIVDIIKSHSDPTLYDRKQDFSDSRLAHLLANKKMNNHLKAENLLGLRK